MKETINSLATYSTISTGLFQEEPVRENFLSPEIRLTGYTVLNKTIAGG